VTHLFVIRLLDMDSDKLVSQDLLSAPALSALLSLSSAPFLAVASLLFSVESEFVLFNLFRRDSS
jgi:hypothetical protein